jgi:hypothetical protein
MTSQTWIDQHIKAIVTHDHQTVPHKGKMVPYIPWEFSFPEMLQGVIVKTRVYNKTTGKYDDVLAPGRIVAYVPDTTDSQAQYRVSYIKLNYVLRRLGSIY